MKPSIVLSTILLAAWGPFASRPSGYIVFHDTDTLRGNIKTNKGILGYSNPFYNSYDAVDFMDSSGHDSTYHPESLSAFGFTDKSGVHFYRSRRHRDSTLKFQELIVAGPKASLYLYVPSGTSNKEEFYRFEKGDGAILFLKNFDALETFSN